MQSLSNGNSPRSSARQSPFRSPRVWIGIPVSLLFLFLALRGQHPDEIRDAFSRVDWRTLPLALLLLYTGITIRAYRWHILLRPVHDIPTRDVFPVMIIGYAANNVLPLRAGELVRAWVLEQRYGVRKTAALDPMFVMVAALGGFMGKLIVLLAAVILLRGQDWLEPKALGITLVATVVVTSILEARASKRSRSQMVVPASEGA